MYPYSVDPLNIPAALSNPQLEYFCLFAIAVAGKSAKQTAAKLDAFMLKNALGDGELFEEDIPLTPFQTINMLVYFQELFGELWEHKFGQYQRIINAWAEVAELDVTHLTVEELEAIKGIGPKTARFIMLYADPSFDGVPLDTHILKWLGKLYNDVPKSTPPAGKRYNELEARFQWAAKLRGKTVRELDTEVWKAYNSGQEHVLGA